MKFSTSIETPRYASAFAIFFALAAAVSTSTFSNVAIAQPSPPEASEPIAEAAGEFDTEPSKVNDDDGGAGNSEVKGAGDNTAPNESGKYEGSDTTDAKQADEPNLEKPVNGEISEVVTTEADPDASTSSSQTTATTDLKKLTVATWSGAYGEAQRNVVIDGFKSKQSVAVRVIVRKGNDHIDLTADSAGALPDAAEFSSHEIDAGCKTGQLAKLTERGHGGVVAPEISSDFLPGSLKPCGIGAFAWSHVIAVNLDAFEKRKPKTLADVFDTKRFPGKRVFLKKPRFLMEMALMADGAEPYEVYGLLENDAGLQRAFAKLESIRDDILWVDNAKAATSAVADGEAVLGQSFSGRAFFAAARGTPVDIIWDGQIYAMTYWGIPAKSPRRALARAFLDFATEPQQLAAVAQRFPYGPTRTSALALTKRHLVAGLDLGGFLPTTPDNMRTALSIDETWWAKNNEAIETALTEWIEKPPKEPASTD